MWYRNPRTGIFTAAVLALSLASLAPPAHADYTVNYNVGGLSASALFKMVGSNLQVDLTSTTNASVPTDVLTAVYFTLDGQTAALTGQTAQVVGSSKILTLGSGYNGGANNTSTPIDVSGEFAYKFDSGGILGVTGDNAIGSTGLGVFPSNTTWQAPSSNANLWGTGPIDGLDFGIVGSVASGANTGVTKQPLIQNSAEFLFSGLPAGFVADAAHIPLVQFNFGTKFAPVPEPMYVQLGVLFGLATIGSGLRAWRGRKDRFAS